MAGKHTAAQPTEITTISSPSMTPPVSDRICGRYEHAIQILGKRWTGLLLDALMQGPKRFCELTALVEGLSDRVLSDRLRELEAEGIVKRSVYPQVPVRVEYELTEKGRGLKPVVDAIHDWAEAWLASSPPASSEIDQQN